MIEDEPSFAICARSLSRRALVLPQVEQVGEVGDCFSLIAD